MVVLLLAARGTQVPFIYVSQGRCSFNARNRGSTIPSSVRSTVPWFQNFMYEEGVER